MKGFGEFPSVIVFFQARFARVVGISAEGYGKFIDGVKRFVEKGRKAPMRRIGIGDLNDVLGNFPDAFGFVRRAFDLNVNGLFVFGFFSDDQPQRRLSGLYFQNRGVFVQSVILDDLASFLDFVNGVQFFEAQVGELCFEIREDKLFSLPRKRFFKNPLFIRLDYFDMLVLYRFGYGNEMQGG